jgi:serine/threonine protein kinase
MTSPGAQIGPYVIRTSIGEGGMGKVYRAHDPRMNRDVAIKVSGERFSDRFSRVSACRRRAESSQHLPSLRRRTRLPGDGTVEGPTLAERIKQRRGARSKKR